VDVAPLLASLESLGADVDVRPALALLAARDYELDPERLNPPVRRAMLLLAAGGDPHREPEVDGRAATALADDVDAPALRDALAGGLDALVPDAAPHPRIAAAIAALRADSDLAVRAWACAILAEELEADG
jgi:hypothetical protein